MIYFIGDAGLDHYIEQDSKRLGGCSLNAATHFKRNCAEATTLIYPANLGSETQEIEKHCQAEAIQTYPLRRQGKLPCQEISISPNGEKKFLHYDSGILEGLELDSREIEYIETLSGIVVAPLYEQILPFIDQIMELNSKAQFFFDFHDAADFSFDMQQMEKYLKRCSFAQFGLSQESFHLKKLLKSYATTFDKEILITQGEKEITLYRAADKLTICPQVVDVIDSTGAGDAFLGAFLALRPRHPIIDVLKLASDYAASSLSKIGAF